MTDADLLADRIRDTVDQWLADNGGGMVSGYVTVINYYDAEGAPCWATAHADRQTPATTLGLLRFHTIAVERQLERYLDDDEDDRP